MGGDLFWGIMGYLPKCNKYQEHGAIKKQEGGKSGNYLNFYFKSSALKLNNLYISEINKVP